MEQPTIDANLARHLLNRVSSLSPYNVDVIKTWQKQCNPDVFNGQVVLSAPRPSGGIVILVGEFVNHGLPAAVGAISTAEVFYGMVEKGLCTSDIVEELNKKLLFILPEGMFLSACIIGLDQEGKILDIWNGGMPDIIVVDNESKIKHRVSSSKYPIGAKPEIDSSPVFIQVDDGDTGYIYAETDHQVKAMWLTPYANQDLEAFLLSSNHSEIETRFLNRQQQDFTIVKFAVSELNNLDKNSNLNQIEKMLPPSNWKMSFNFQSSTLKNVEIVPLIVNALMHIQAPNQHRQRIYTVLAELCSNALDHGVLGLSSELKKSPNGFAEYYMLRGQRLEQLESGFIKVDLQHESLDSGGKLSVTVEDSGDGFDYQHFPNNENDEHTFSGRGVSLLNQLCNKVHYSGNGNSAHIEYVWS